MASLGLPFWNFDLSGVQKLSINNDSLNFVSVDFLENYLQKS